MSEFQQNKKKKKGRPPAHQNKFAWIHNPKSKKTDKILSSPIADVCKRCKEKLEWRKQYRKYKPLTQPATCNKCTQKVIRMAYHTVCGPCRKTDGRDLCGVCFKEKVGRGPGMGGRLSIEEELERAGPMKLREKKAFIRKLERKWAEEDGEEAGGGGDGGESCEEFSVSEEEEEEEDVADSPAMVTNSSVIDESRVTMTNVDPSKSIVIDNATVVTNGEGSFLVTANNSNTNPPVESTTFEEVRFFREDGEDIVLSGPSVVMDGNKILVRGGGDEVEGFGDQAVEEEAVDLEAMKADMISAFSKHGVVNVAAGSAQPTKDTQPTNEGIVQTKAEEDPFAKGDLFGCSSARNYPRFKF